MAAQLVNTLRQNGISADFDHMGRSLKAQMKYADKLGAKYTLVLGDNEIADKKARIKNMESGEQTEFELDMLSEFFRRNR